MSTFLSKTALECPLCPAHINKTYLLHSIGTLGRFFENYWVVVLFSSPEVLPRYYIAEASRHLLFPPDLTNSHPFRIQKSRIQKNQPRGHTSIYLVSYTTKTSW